MDVDAAVDRSVEVSDILDSLSRIGDHFIAWAVGKKLLAGYRRDVRRLHEVAGELSDRWHELAVVQVAGVEFMRRPAMIRKYLAQYGDILVPEQRTLLREFMRRPWFWSLFSVTEQVRGDLYRVVDHLSDCERLFYSSALTDLTRQGERLFFTGAYSNGLCCQTFGVVHYFRGFQPPDFTYLAKALSPNVLRAQGLEAAVAARPAYYVLLSRWAENPVPVFAGQHLQFFAHEQAVRSFSVDRCSPDFDIKEVSNPGRLFAGTLRDRESPFQIAVFYYATDKRVLSVMTTSQDLYREIARLLRGQVELPAEAEWSASPNMAIAGKELPGVRSPLVKCLEYQELAQPERDEDRAASASLEPINALLQELTNRRNLGVEYRLEELAESYGVEPETARQLEATVTRLDERFEIDLPGGIADYRPPPPEVRRRMSAVPSKSDLFALDFGPAAHGAFAEQAPRVRTLLAEYREMGLNVQAADYGPAQELSLKMLPRIVDDLFFAYWEADDATLLTYTLCLLHHAGSTQHQVSDYACEVLRVFWQVLLPKNTRTQIRGFIEQYALFCWNVLEPLGVVEVDEEIDDMPASGRVSRAGFRMSGGPLLRSFFRLSRYWE